MANGTGYPWQRYFCLLLLLLLLWGIEDSVWLHFQFFQRRRPSGFLCEIFQFLNVGTKMFRNTKRAKLALSVCRMHPVSLEGAACGLDGVKSLSHLSKDLPW